MSTTLESQGRPVPPDHRLPAPQNGDSVPARRRSFWWVWLLLALAAGYGTYRWYIQSQKTKADATSQQEKRAANRPVPVIAAKIRRGDMPVYLRGLGNVTAFNTVTVKSRVDGQLTQVAFQEGQFVNKGDLLAQIDPRPYQVQLDVALGQLARDQAMLKDAQVNLGRDQALWEGQVIAKQQLDTQAASVNQDKGTLSSDQANIDNAKLNLTFARITAPISGRIGLRLVDAGNIVHAADPNGLVVITQIQPIAVLFTIPADNLQPVLKKLRAGVKLEVDAYDRDDKNKVATGSLVTLDNTIDQTTGTARLKAVFNNEDGVLFPNQFVNCRLLLDVRRGALLAPVAAIQRGPQGSFVYVVNADKEAEVRPVTVGLTEANESEILSGLQANEMVVTDGQDRLQAGTHLDVRTASPGRAAGAGRASAASNSPTTDAVKPTPPNAANGQALPGMTPAARAGAAQGMPPGQIPTTTTPLGSATNGAAGRGSHRRAEGGRPLGGGRQ